MDRQEGIDGLQLDDQLTLDEQVKTGLSDNLAFVRH
jgi:hypothetical protein